MTDPLTDEQVTAVRHTHGAMILDAPAGSGKTTVLAHRVSEAVGAGVSPDRILCLSFSNRACREIQDRLRQIRMPGANRVTARTFHGLCTAVLRVECKRIGLTPDFLICDEEDADEYMKRAVQSLFPAQAEPDLIMLGRFMSKFVEQLKAKLLPPYDVRQVADLFDQARERETLNLPSDFNAKKVFDRYEQMLLRDQQLDFADLISRVRYLFYHHPSVLSGWQERYVWLQVDEYQDTSLEQYAILRQLAATHGNFALFGDIDQTIYEWRGSTPRQIRAEFVAEFLPRQLRLTLNHRSSATILAAAEAVIRACEGTCTTALRPARPRVGTPIKVCRLAGPETEADWVADQVDGLVRTPPHSGYRIAVLARANARARRISTAFKSRDIQHLTVEDNRFFRRPEIRDAAACLRAVANPFDNVSLVRLLGLPAFGIPGPELQNLRRELYKAGMQVADLVDSANDAGKDPFDLLLTGLAAGKVVVFDVETSGLDPATARVLEVAAIRVGTSGVTQRFHRCLNWEIDPGQFACDYGLTREVLAQEGVSPARALEEFAAFCEGAVLVGHNLRFDLGMIAADAARTGIQFRPPDRWYDTVDLARRFSPNLVQYTLEEVTRALRIRPTHYHRAAEDANSTAQVLLYFAPELAKRAGHRQNVLASLHPGFSRAGRSLARWKAMAPAVRPDQLLASVILDVNLCHHGPGPTQARHQSLSELVDLFRKYDCPDQLPQQVLSSLLELVSLGIDTDRAAGNETGVFVGTVHQAKGLEFDSVFLTGATDNEFPSFRSQQEGRLSEEHRLFYVAMSRAQAELTITYPATESGGQRVPSRFLKFIPSEVRQDEDLDLPNESDDLNASLPPF